MISWFLLLADTINLDSGLRASQSENALLIVRSLKEYPITMTIFSLDNLFLKY